MTLALLAAAASATAGVPTRLNPVDLFLHADIVVQLVMGGFCSPACGCG
jgi:biopolymer transport protein TolQ